MYILWIMLMAAGFGLAWMFSQKLNKQTAYARPLVAGGLTVLALSLFVINATSYNNRSLSRATTARAGSAPSSFQTAGSWKMPDGSKGYAVIISPSMANGQDLEAVGDSLKKTYEGDSAVLVMVVTSSQAAATVLKDPMSVINKNLNPQDLKALNAQFVAQYQKNTLSKLNSYSMFPKGAGNGEPRTITY